MTLLRPPLHFGRLRKVAALLHPHVPGPGHALDEQEARVVAGVRVFPAGIAQAHDGPHGLFLLGLFLLALFLDDLGLGGGGRGGFGGHDFLFRLDLDLLLVRDLDQGEDRRSAR